MSEILSVSPTVLFRNKNGVLLNVVDVRIRGLNNPGQYILQLRRSAEEKPHSYPLNTRDGSPADGMENRADEAASFRIEVPDIRETCAARAELISGQETLHALEFEWEPRKHWDIHLVPIAHHDYSYTGSIRDVLSVYRTIYNDALNFCEITDTWSEEAKFHYTAEGAWSLRHFVEVSGPKTIERLRKYVSEGRIEIPAFLGNEISCLCGHEELVRLLYPSVKLQSLLGGEILTGSITDIPGMCWALPTMLRGAGAKYFLAGLPPYFGGDGTLPMHTSWDEAAILREHGAPDAFYWKGPDGGKVLVYYQVSYGCWSPDSVDDVLSQLPPILDGIDKKGNPFSVARFGGYGCGDNEPTTMLVSELVRDWNGEWAYPKLRVSTNTRFFNALETQCDGLRIFSGELPHTDYSIGALCSAKETALNRMTHDLLPFAERFNAIASDQDGARNRSTDLEQAFADMVMFDEHTWGRWAPLSYGQDFTWHDKSAHAYRAAGLAYEILRDSVQAIAGNIRLPDESYYVTVFNALAMERSDIVEVNGFHRADLKLVDHFCPDSMNFELIDPDTGAAVPFQIRERRSAQDPAPQAAEFFAMGRFHPGIRHDLVFKADSVPATGYKTYQIREISTDTKTDVGVPVTERTIENEYYLVSFDPVTGSILSIYDKELSCELVDTQADDSVNELVIKDVETANRMSPDDSKILFRESGPVSGRILCSCTAPGCPHVVREIMLHQGLKRVDFNNRVLKDCTPFQELYFAFPFGLEDPAIRFEGCNSVIEPFKDQFPGSNTNYYSTQHWAELTGSGLTITFTSVDAHTVEFGGLWPSHVSQAHFGIKPVDYRDGFIDKSEMRNGHIYSFALVSNFCTNFKPVQQGDMLFRYSITSRSTGWPDSASRDFGWSRSNDLFPVLSYGPNDGARTLSRGFLCTNKPNVWLTALKRAEDGDGFILRFVETSGVQTDFSVTLPTERASSACYTDLVERNGAPAEIHYNELDLSIGRFGFCTVRLRA